MMARVCKKGSMEAKDDRDGDEDKKIFKATVGSNYGGG